MKRKTAHFLHIFCTLCFSGARVCEERTCNCTRVTRRNAQSVLCYCEFLLGCERVLAMRANHADGFESSFSTTPFNQPPPNMKRNTAHFLHSFCTFVSGAGLPRAATRKHHSRQEEHSSHSSHREL